MSDRRLIITHETAAVRLAVHLGREDAGLYRTAESIARDVDAIIKAGLEARRALARKRSPEAAYAQAAKVAETYGARVVRHGEIDGVSLGLRFWSARFGQAVFRVS